MGISLVERFRGRPYSFPSSHRSVGQWRYEPWLLNGQPIEMQATIEVVFSLTK